MRAFIWLGIILPLCALGQNTAGYNLIVLNDNPDIDNTCITDINNRNQVVGYGYVSTSTGTGKYRRGFVWQNAQLKLLEPLFPDCETVATGINDNGVIVGYAYIQNDVSASENDRVFHACYWTDKGSIVDMGTLGEMRSAFLDINNNGKMVGYAGVADYPNAGDYFERVISMQDNSIMLCPYYGESGSWWGVLNEVSESWLVRFDRRFSLDVPVAIIDEMCIDEAGNIAVSYKSSLPLTCSFVWSDTGITMLSEPDFAVYDMNDYGVMVGQQVLVSILSGVHYRPQLCIDGHVVNEYVGGYGQSGVIYAINNAGTMVGSYVGDDYQDGDAFVYEDSTWKYLKDVVAVPDGAELLFATAINDSGFIGGNGRFDYSQKDQAFILAPKNMNIVMNVPSRLQVTLLEASAVLVSDIYLEEPDRSLLIENNLINQGVVANAVYNSGTEVVFSIVVHGASGDYRYRSDSKFARTSAVNEREWIIRFEDLPDSLADWDFNDVVIKVELLEPLSTSRAARDGSGHAPAVLVRREKVEFAAEVDPESVTLFSLKGEVLPVSKAFAGGKMIVSLPGNLPGPFVARYSAKGTTRNCLVRRTW